jgi:hypothetical protein
MSSSEHAENRDGELSWLLRRPMRSLHEIPPAYRWEVTRRHPHYLLFWQFAQRYHTGGITDPSDELLCGAAVEVLLAIGVSGDLKKREGIAERRRRHEKLDEYLRVWDLREGWTGSGYDPSAEKPFTKIAAETRSRLSTVANRYAAGFRLICGHRHTFVNWYHLFAVLKLTRQFGPACLARRHLHSEPRKAKRVETVSLTRLSGRSKRRLSDFADLRACLEDNSIDIEARDTAKQINRLIEIGAADEEILRKIDPDKPEQMLKLIEYFRARTS